jgi:hypothetical protein
LVFIFNSKHPDAGHPHNNKLVFARLYKTEQRSAWNIPNIIKISVTYDQSSTEGLIAEDMMKSISAKYGPPTSVVPEPASTLSVGYGTQQRPMASWEDAKYAKYSFKLVRTSFTDRFGLVIYSKRVNTDAELALVEAARVEKQEAPAREAERQKKQTDDRELARQKNQKNFRP